MDRMDLNGDGGSMEPVILTAKDVQNIPKRRQDAHKGSFGHVLIIAGSKGMSGAAFLSSLSAYRSGAGLVKIFTVEDNRAILQTSIPEAIVVSYEPEEVGSEGFRDLLNENLAWASVIVIGPGLSTLEYASEILEEVLSEAFVPLIIDADALNILAENPFLTRYYTENIIITPHLGEMSRLTKLEVQRIRQDRIGVATEYQNMYGITVVLKSHETIIATREHVYVNTSGTPALAKAGSGDVLTGIIAGMLCIGVSDEEAPAYACLLHGLAGRLAAKKLGEHSVIARDVINYLPYVLDGKYA